MNSFLLDLCSTRKRAVVSYLLYKAMREHTLVILLVIYAGLPIRRRSVPTHTLVCIETFQRVQHNAGRK